MLCDRCGTDSNKCVMPFGKHICINCRNNRPLKGTGNSGMFSTGQLGFVYNESLHLYKVRKSDGYFGKLYFEHYPGSRGIVGRSINYLVMNKNECIGIIGGSSPPKNYGIFNIYFGKNNENYYFNNNVFRLIKSEHNIGTRVLKLFRNTIRLDYSHKYNEDLIGLCTFVEIPRTGALYKADNWDYLGLTQGKRMYRRGENWEKTFIDGERKHIYGYKYKTSSQRIKE
jgi:hypothetical protein